MAQNRGRQQTEENSELQSKLHLYTTPSVRSDPDSVLFTAPNLLGDPGRSIQLRHARFLVPETCDNTCLLLKPAALGNVVPQQQTTNSVITQRATPAPYSSPLLSAHAPFQPHWPPLLNSSLARYILLPCLYTAVHSSVLSISRPVTGWLLLVVLLEIETSLLSKYLAQNAHITILNT